MCHGSRVRKRMCVILLAVCGMSCDIYHDFLQRGSQGSYHFHQLTWIHLKQLSCKIPEVKGCSPSLPLI